MTFVILLFQRHATARRATARALGSRLYDMRKNTAASDGCAAASVTPLMPIAVSIQSIWRAAKSRHDAA